MFLWAINEIRAITSSELVQYPRPPKSLRRSQPFSAYRAAKRDDYKDFIYQMGKNINLFAKIHKGKNLLTLLRENVHRRKKVLLLCLKAHNLPIDIIRLAASFVEDRSLRCLQLALLKQRYTISSLSIESQNVVYEGLYEGQSGDFRFRILGTLLLEAVKTSNFLLLELLESVGENFCQSMGQIAVDWDGNHIFEREEEALPAPICWAMDQGKVELFQFFWNRRKSCCVDTIARKAAELTSSPLEEHKQILQIISNSLR